jgi:RNA polymerase sigma factor (sigma-70 family)
MMMFQPAREMAPMADSGRVFETLRTALVKRAATMVRGCSGPGFPDPEDFAQVVLTKLFAQYGEETLQSFDPPRCFALAYKVLHNAVVDEIRRKREAYLPDDGTDRDRIVELVSDGEDPVEAIERGQTMGTLRACLEEVLDSDERRFLLLSFELDSAPEAQKECGWPPGAPSPSSLCHLRRRLLRRVMRGLAEN